MEMEASKLGCLRYSTDGLHCGWSISRTMDQRQLRQRFSQLPPGARCVVWSLQRIKHARPSQTMVTLSGDIPLNLVEWLLKILLFQHVSTILLPINESAPLMFTYFWLRFCLNMTKQPLVLPFWILTAKHSQVPMFRGPWILAAGAWTSPDIAHPALHVEVLQLGTCSWVGGSNLVVASATKKTVVSSKCEMSSLPKLWKLLH